MFLSIARQHKSNESKLKRGTRLNARHFALGLLAVPQMNTPAVRPPARTHIRVPDLNEGVAEWCIAVRRHGVCHACGISRNFTHLIDVVLQLIDRVADIVEALLRTAK